MINFKTIIWKAKINLFNLNHPKIKGKYNLRGSQGNSNNILLRRMNDGL